MLHLLGLISYTPPSFPPPFEPSTNGQALRKFRATHAGPVSNPLLYRNLSNPKIIIILNVAGHKMEYPRLVGVISEERIIKHPSANSGVPHSGSTSPTRAISGSFILGNLLVRSLNTLNPFRLGFRVWGLALLGNWPRASNLPTG